MRAAWGAALAALALSRGASADLSSDADELARRWSEGGRKAARLAPVFLEHGRPKPVRVPPRALDPNGPRCTTIAFLSGRSTDFVVRIDPVVTPKHHAGGGHVERSVAGAVLLSHCGPAREAFTRLAVEARIARAAVEIVVAVGDASAPAVADALPERAPGPTAPLTDPGPRGPFEPLAARVRRAEQRAKSAGASSIAVQTYSAEPDGSGRQVLRVAEGCHRMELFAELRGRYAIDLDAELRDTSSERLLARDRSDAPDARLEWCAGQPMGVDLLFAGAPGPVEVLLIDAVYPLPTGVPSAWGPRARAGLASALWRKKITALDAVPMDQRLGVAGVTSVPIPIEPGRCYLAALAPMRGDPRSVSLSARVDTRVAFDATGGLTEGAAVAFCSYGAEIARLDAEVRGSAVAWVLDVWQLGHHTFEDAP